MGDRRDVGGQVQHVGQFEDVGRLGHVHARAQRRQRFGDGRHRQFVLGQVLGRPGQRTGQLQVGLLRSRCAGSCRPGSATWPARVHGAPAFRGRRPPARRRRRSSNSGSRGPACRPGAGRPAARPPAPSPSGPAPPSPTRCARSWRPPRRPGGTNAARLPRSATTRTALGARSADPGSGSSQVAVAHHRQPGVPAAASDDHPRHQQPGNPRGLFGVEGERPEHQGSGAGQSGQLGGVLKPLQEGAPPRVRLGRAGDVGARVAAQADHALAPSDPGHRRVVH